MVFSHCDKLFDEYDDTKRVAERVVVADLFDGSFILICGSFVTGAGGVGHVQSTPVLFKAGKSSLSVIPRTRSPFKGILHILF